MCSCMRATSSIRSSPRPAPIPPCSTRSPGSTMPDIPLVIVTGNHSMVKTRYTTSPLAVLDYHPAEIHAAYSFKYERVEIGDTVFHLIPNMLRVEDYRTAYDAVELAPGRNNVLVTHGLSHCDKG